MLSEAAPAGSPLESQAENVLNGTIRSDRKIPPRDVAPVCPD
jgi:hypothetical protein